MPIDQSLFAPQASPWQNVNLGEDAGPHRARVALQEHGHFLHGWIKFGRPGDRVYQLHIALDLRPLVEQLEAAAARQVGEEPGTPGAVSGGRFMRKLRHRIKRAVKKIAHSKLVRGITKVAKAALNNPLVKGMIAAVPGGAAVLAVRAAARVVAKAVRGGLKAKAFISHVADGVRQGDPQAVRVARLLKQGAKYSGVARALPMSAAAGAAGELDYLAHVMGSVLATNPGTAEAGGRFLLVAGDDGGTEEHDADAVDMVANSGAFEGIRWLAQRMGLHSMAAHADEFTSRNALMLGHSVMAAPRH